MSSIKTYARIKPSLTQFEDVDVVDTDLFLRIPDTVQYYTSFGKGRNKITHQFHFDHVFGEHANQEDVFNTVAIEIVDAFVNGYNGTIFAYGQTGTGKTYTVEGGARRYSERGLASRAVSRIYHSLEEREEEVVSVKVSFLEIYQEVGYDLLSPASRTGWLVTPFPRVSVMEGPGSSCLIRNLSCHLAASEELAQNLLLQGQANRKVAETPVNQRSSRSHAVFTVFLTTKKPNSDIVVRSKLHLVDLAGSERVAKTGVDGQQLSEAKSINLSLHHLESVIIALQSGPGDKKQARRGSSDMGVEMTSDPHSSPKHVPYRNSLLTMVLRDSLGGNCLTAMIATVSLEWPNLGETISTCRFAQRVACISNCIRRNEEIDDKSLVKILRRKIAELETEISCMKLQSEGTEGHSEEMCGKLSEEDKVQCVQIIQDYLAGRLRDPITAGITSPFKFRECLRILKAVVKESSVSVNMPDKSSQRPACGPSQRPHSTPSSGTSQSIRAEEDPVNNGLGEEYSECPSRVVMRNRSQSMSNLGRHAETSSIQKCSSVTRTQSVSGGTTSDCWTGLKSVKKRPQSAQPAMASSKSPYLQKQGRRSRRAGSPWNSNVHQTQSDIDLTNVDLNNSRIVELIRLVDNLESKRGLVESQISELKTHMSYLRANDAGGQALLEAQLLEKRLYKRQASVSAKLQRVYQQLSRLSGHENEHELADSHTVDTPSWQDKFGQHRKSDGSLNTRQVFQKLQTEDNIPAKKEFASDNGTADSELDMKVEATRQKLSHFKRLLTQKDSLRCEWAGGSPAPKGQGQPFSSPTQTSTPNSRALAGEMDRRGLRQNKGWASSSLRIEDLKGGVDTSISQRFEVVNGQDNDSYPLTLQQCFSEDTRKFLEERQPGMQFSELPGSSLYNSVKQPVQDLEQHTELAVDNRQLYTPSEYVNQIDKREVFDAHQMGLYSKTFESALHSMLERDNAKLFSHKNYNKYARRRPRYSSPNRTTSWDTKDQIDDLSPAPEPYRMPQDCLSSPMVKETHSTEYISDDIGVKVKAIPENEQEFSFLSKAKEQKNRIEKIRRAQHSASVIQRAWRQHRCRTVNRS
ncbi:uncharacterized protein LOC135468448 isoform X2 [Liolophura sinensis]|uniref:uncharacterized protein LOC135468448 isoform X2 n=1 Tax=Liolophura sinensis TaxID=3198878 RepID=UPI00315860AF